MHVAVFSSQLYERPFLDRANAGRHTLHHLDASLTLRTASLANDCQAVSIFVSDDASSPVLETLHASGVRLLALRSAGFNHVDTAAAARLGLTVLRVPAYSPYAVAEHAVGLMLTLNRKFHRAFNRVREQNFALGGLMGFDMHAKVAGVIGTGTIGLVVCRILQGFGCTVLASDPAPSPELARMGIAVVSLDELLRRSDIITLHCPLNPQTHHLINADAIAKMKDGVMLVNTSRGGVIDTRALIAALKRDKFSGVGLDVYEEEADLFFQDLSAQPLHDDIFIRLMSFPNVLITAHQGFFTHEAVTAIAQTTIANLSDFEAGRIDPSRAIGLDRARPRA